MATERMYLCGLCGMAFPKHQQLGPHSRVCRRRNNIIRHAEFLDTNDNVTWEFDAIPDTTPTQLPAPVATLSMNPEIPQLPTQTPQVPIIPTQTTQVPTQISELCARTGVGPRSVVEDAPLSRNQNVVQPNPLLTSNFCPLQRAWNAHVQSLYHMCDPEFWKMFEAVLLQSTKCVDDVLSTCLDVLAKKSATIIKCWPRSKRTLRDLISRKLGNFWSAVTITKTIDLRRFNLPGVHHLPTRHMCLTCNSHTMHMQCMCNLHGTHM